MTAYPPLTETDINALARMGLPRTSLDLPKENTTVSARERPAIAADLPPAAPPNGLEARRGHRPG